MATLQIPARQLELGDRIVDIPCSFALHELGNRAGGAQRVAHLERAPGSVYVWLGDPADPPADTVQCHLALNHGDSVKVERSAASWQASSYDGVSSADLAVIRHALATVPASLDVIAVWGRVNGAIERKRNQR